MIVEVPVGQNEGGIGLYSLYSLFGSLYSVFGDFAVIGSEMGPVASDCSANYGMKSDSFRAWTVHDAEKTASVYEQRVTVSCFMRGLGNPGIQSLGFFNGWLNRI